MFNIFKYDINRPGASVFRVGGMVIIPVIIFVGIWMAYAPLSSATIAPGQIVLSADRNIVQHLEGGIIEKLFVSEGQLIKKDDPILLIRSLPQKSKRIVLYNRIIDTRALILRLQAQVEGSNDINFSSVGKDLDDSLVEIEEYIKQQKNMFVEYIKLLTSRENLLSARSNKIEIEIEGIIARLNAKKKQVRIENDLYSIKSTLQRKGLIPKEELLLLEKSIAILEGEVDSDIATIASLKRNVAVLKLEEAERKEQERMAFLTELQQLQSTLKTLEQEIKTLDDELYRTLIKAPIDGKVLDLQIQAAGEVLPSGGRILDIIPIEQNLIVESKVNPQDIEAIVSGTKAKIQLSAYSNKKAPRLDGIVMTVSGDVLVDELTGGNYYLVRIEVDISPLETLPSDIILSPGMPADVFLFAQDRTLLDYLIAPITNATYRAFREE